MNISVPSRFAVLKIEDDDNRPNSKNASKKLDPKHNKNNKPVKKIPTTTTNNKQSSSKKQRNKQNEAQWEEWKKKDREMVNDNYEQDLQDALLQSKIDYEANKKLNGVTKNSEKLKQPSVNGNKKKKNKTMYLDEFLGSPEKNQESNNCEEQPEKVNEDDFFEKMVQQAKKEVIKGKIEEGRKERELHIDEVISLAQCQEKLKKEQAHSANLQKQLDEAKAEICEVKARNKTLCSILGHGEMRDKAEILLELDRLNLVKDELTEEVTNLHKLLEQERSKTAPITDLSSKNKDKKRKKI